MDAEQSLRNVALFRNLQQKQIKSLADWTTTRSYDTGQDLVREGQTGLGLYCIESGRVKVTQRTAEGEREIRTMGPGESFGELSLLDNQPRSATITALEPTTALLLDKGQFLAAMRTHPEIALEILPVLAGWIREADRRIAELS